MNRRTSLLIGTFLMLLSACGSEVTSSYTLTIKTTDATKTTTLLEGVERVLTRKFAASGIEDATITVVPTSPTTATLTLMFKENAGADEAQRIIADPFTLDFRLEKPGAVSEEAAEWEPAGIDGSHIEWVQAIGNRQTGEIGVEITFTDEGKKLLADTFRGRSGRNIGIFVKDILVSKLKITSEKLDDRIVIGGVPNAAIAEVFADDVNVGLHVRFIPATVPVP